MMNPFGSGMPIDSMNQLLFRQTYIDILKNRIENKKQTVILGVEGVGKTSLLRSFFCSNYRKEKAKNDGILISPVTEFPTDIDANDCYNHFVKMVINAVKILGHCGKNDEMRSILEEIEECKSVGNAQECFESTIDAIKNNGYRVVMLIDNFERFTLSKTITKEHHGILLKLLDHCQYIVTTNYDLNKDTLPNYVSGSFFLMRFGGNEIRVSGWSEDETKMFIEKQLQGNDIHFSEDLIKKIHKVSGGIPMLLNTTAKFVYDTISKNNSEKDFDFGKVLYNDNFVQVLLAHWCKMISPAQEKALCKLIAEEKFDSGTEANLRTLYSRGILNYKTTIDKYGRKRIDDTQYEFCCDFIHEFCKDKEKLRDAMRKSPFFSCDELEELKENILKNSFKPDEPYVFISYPHANQKDVFEDVCRLKKICNCWIDFENLDGGRVENTDDWTKKVQPVLENKNCKGVIMYVSKEGFNSNGLMREAEWIHDNRTLDFYTFWIGFNNTITPEEMADIISNIQDENMQRKLRKISAFSFVAQINKNDTEFSYYHRQDMFSHLSHSDFHNWLKKIKMI